MRSIETLHNEVYNENYREKQRTGESIHDHSERYWSRSNDYRDDRFDAGEQNSNGYSREIYRRKPERNRGGDPRQGDRNSRDIKSDSKDHAGKVRFPKKFERLKA